MNTRQYQLEGPRPIGRNTLTVTPSNSVNKDKHSRNASRNNSYGREGSFTPNKNTHLSPISKQVFDNPLTRTIGTLNLTAKDNRNYRKKTISRGHEENSQNKIVNHYVNSSKKIENSKHNSSQKKTPRDLEIERLSKSPQPKKTPYQTNFSNYNQFSNTHTSNHGNQLTYDQQRRLQYNDNNSQKIANNQNVKYNEQKPSLSPGVTHHRYDERDLSPYSRSILLSQTNLTMGLNNSYMRPSQSNYTINNKPNLQTSYGNILSVNEQTPEVRKSIDNTHLNQNKSVLTTNQRGSMTNKSSTNIRGTMDESSYRPHEESRKSTTNMRGTMDESSYRPHDESRKSTTNMRGTYDESTYRPHDESRKSATNFRATMDESSYRPHDESNNSSKLITPKEIKKNTYDRFLKTEDFKNTSENALPDNTGSAKDVTLANERRSQMLDSKYNPLLTRISQTRHNNDDSLSRSMSKSPGPRTSYTKQMYYKIIGMNNNLINPAPESDKKEPKTRSASPKKDIDIIIDNYSPISKDYLRDLTPAKSKDDAKDNSFLNKSLFSEHNHEKSAKNIEISVSPDFDRSLLVRDSILSQSKRAGLSVENYNAHHLNTESANFNENCLTKNNETSLSPDFDRSLLVRDNILSQSKKDRLSVENYNANHLYTESANFNEKRLTTESVNYHHLPTESANFNEKRLTTESVNFNANRLNTESANFNANRLNTESARSFTQVCTTQNEINKYYPIVKRANEVWNFYINSLQQQDNFDKSKDALDNQLSNIKKENTELSNYLVSMDSFNKESATTVPINFASIKTTLKELEALMNKLNDVFVEDRGNMKGILYNEMKNTKLEFYKEAQEIKKLKENLLMTLDFLTNITTHKKNSNESLKMDNEIQELVKDNIYYNKKCTRLKDKNKHLIKELERVQDWANKGVQDWANNHVNNSSQDMKNQMTMLNLSNQLDSKNTFAEVISFEDKKLKTLEETVKNLSETNVHLQTELEAFKKQNHIKWQEKEELIKENIDQSENYHQLARNCDKLLEENKKQTDTRNSMQLAPMTSKSNQDTEKISDLLQALTKLKKYNLEFENEKSALKECYDVKKLENENLHLKIEGLQSAKIDLIDHLEKITTDLNSMQRERDMLLNDRKQAEQTVERQENENLRIKITNYTTELGMMHKNYYDMEKILHNSLDIKNKLETDNRDLKDENSLMKKDFEQKTHELHDQQDNIANENITLEGGCNQLMDDNRDLAERVEQLISEKAYLENDKDAYSKENEVINSEINSMKDALVKFKDDYSCEKSKYKEYYSQLEYENKNLKKIIETINNENEDLVSTNLKLQNDKESLSNKSLANQVDADFTTERFMNIASVRPEPAEMLKMKVENDALHRQIESLSLQNTEILFKYERLKQDFEGIYSHRDRTKSDNEELSTIYEKYRDEHCNKNSNYEKMQESKYYSEKKYGIEDSEIAVMYEQKTIELKDAISKHEKLVVDFDILRSKHNKLLNDHYYLEGRVISNKEEFQFKVEELEYECNTLEKDQEVARSTNCENKSQRSIINNPKYADEKNTITECALAEISFDTSQIEGTDKKSPFINLDKVQDNKKYKSKSPTYLPRKDIEMESEKQSPSKKIVNNKFYQSIGEKMLNQHKKSYSSTNVNSSPTKKNNASPTKKNNASPTIKNNASPTDIKKVLPINLPNDNSTSTNLFTETIEQTKSTEDIKKDQFSEKVESLEDKVNILCSSLKKQSKETVISPARKMSGKHPLFNVIAKKSIGTTKEVPLIRKKSIDVTKEVKFRLEPKFLTCDSNHCINVYKTSNEEGEDNLDYSLEKIPEFKAIHKKTLHAFVTNCDNQYLYGGLDTGHVIEWDLLNKGKIRRVLPKINESKITKLLMNQDDTVLIGTDFNGNLLQWCIGEEMKSPSRKLDTSNLDESISHSVTACQLINSDREGRTIILPAICGLALTKNNQHVFALNKRGVLMQFTRTVGDNNEVKYKQTFLARAKHLLGTKVDNLLVSNDSSNVFILSKENSDLVQIPIGDDEKGIALSFEDRWSYKDVLVKNNLFRISFVVISNDSKNVFIADVEANLTQIAISTKKLVRNFGKIFEPNIVCVAQSYMTKHVGKEYIFFGDTSGQVIKYDYIEKTYKVLPISETGNSKPLYVKNLKIQELIVSLDNQYLFVTYSNKSNSCSVTIYDIKKDKFVRNYDFSEIGKANKSITRVLSLCSANN